MTLEIETLLGSPMYGNAMFCTGRVACPMARGGAEYNYTERLIYLGITDIYVYVPNV